MFKKPIKAVKIQKIGETYEHTQLQMNPLPMRI